MYERLINFIGARFASRYRLNSLLGAGGMGGVFSAFDQLLKRDVAIKVLHANSASGEDEPAALVQEARSLARLYDSHFFPDVYDLIFAVGRDPSFMVFELLQGKPLWATIRHNDDPPSTSWCLDVAIQIAKSLVTMHSRGIIHQDMKPRNIFLVDASDSSDFLKILDLGVSVTHQQLNEAGSRSSTLNAGTLSHMAPEILSGGEITAKADIYSFGVLLVELSASEFPFSEESHGPSMRSLISDPSSIATNPRSERMPALFWPLLVRMLSDDPIKRPNAGECLQELREIKHQYSLE